MTKAKAKQKPATSAAQRTKLRCAVYTRKSSEEGLEQSFNSLHAQREACEAFVASQQHEGWILLRNAYDDGGLSGGSMERPALKRLLEDVRSGLIDVVVVYKVDRLTRSLADFAKLTELFDANATSFVSVTQAFNTSTSMGRLTLNVLLSFAQFEREVAGERIRDKIALSKRRGMWMGGLPPLGYDVCERKLVPNPAEAHTVRTIFRRYLKIGSIAGLKRSLDADGVVSKQRMFAAGRQAGGVPISRGAVYQILRNPTYRGKVAHRGEVHEGEHEAIVDDDLWHAVQARLTDQSFRERCPNDRSGGPAKLVGIVFDQDGNRLTPTYAIKGSRRYRYYVSAPLVRGASGTGIRVPAADLEGAVEQALAGRLTDPLWLADIYGGGDVRQISRMIDAAGRPLRQLQDNVRDDFVTGDARPAILRIIERVEVAEDGLAITIDRQRLLAALAQIDPACASSVEAEGDRIVIRRPAILSRQGKQVRLVLGAISASRRSADPDLIKLVRDGSRWFEDLRTRRVATITAIARRDRQDVAHVSRVLSLAFIAPEIVDMILSGRQPAELTASRLKAACPLPINWDDQRAALL